MNIFPCPHCGHAIAITSITAVSATPMEESIDLRNIAMPERLVNALLWDSKTPTIGTLLDLGTNRLLMYPNVAKKSVQNAKELLKQLYNIEITREGRNRENCS